MKLGHPDPASDAERLNAVLRGIRKVNQLITKVNDRMELIQGACDSLTEGLSYHSSWIALLDQDASCATATASSGLGHTFHPVIENILRGEFTDCMKQALSGSTGVLVVDDPSTRCPGCPMAERNSGKSGFASRLAFNGKTYGVLVVSVPRQYEHNRNEQELFGEVANDLSFALHKIESAEHLRHAERSYETLFREMMNGFALHEILCDSRGRPVDYRFLSVNPAFERLTGLKPDDLIGRTVREVLPETEPHWIETYGRVALTGEPASFENESRALGRWFEVMAFRPAPGQFACFFVDITERREMERQNRTFADIIHRSHDFIGVANPNRHEIFVNPAGRSMMGLEDDELLQRITIEDFFFPEDLPFLHQTILPTVRKEGRWSDEFRFRHFTTGEPVHVLYELFMSEEPETGKLDNLSTISRDISRHKADEDALGQREELLRKIFDILPIGLWFSDKEGRLLRGNPAGIRIWGAEPKVPPSEYGVFKAWRLPSRDPVCPEDWALAKTIRTGETILDELLEIEAFDGTRKTILNYTAPLRDKDGGISGAIVLNLDVSDRHLLEEQLRQAQKMESIGQLAGGVAHEFNNMLGAILGNAELVLEQLSPNSPLREEVREIIQAAQRSTEVTRQLLAFARKQMIAPKVLDLNETVSDMIKILSRLIGEDIQLSWKPGNKLPPVKMDPSQMHQILANLCVNARDAIRDVGNLTIETDIVSLDELGCATHPEAQPGEYVLLSVHDDGCGMDQYTLAHLFEPFFTTKEIGHGTGLGLATVYGIVKQNQGFITVSSDHGKGSMFRVHLPAYRSAPPPFPVAADRSDPRAQGETILLVEDEPSILKLSTAILKKQGYTVLPAPDPGSALRLAEENDGTIDLLVTDVIMSGMNGRDLALRLQSLHPGLKVLFMSGYTADVIAQHGVLEDGVHFIQKPFAKADFTEEVRKILQSSDPG